MDISFIAKILNWAMEGLLKKKTTRMKISSIGLDLITRFEGFRAAPYNDAGKEPTIGFGHLIKPGEQFTTITRNQALDLLTKDVHFAEDAVNTLVKVRLTQDQFDALTSFVFNTGRENFE